jgi:uncharacterized short protein YbdD (DUF466 family)
MNNRRMNTTAVIRVQKERGQTMKMLICIYAVDNYPDSQATNPNTCNPMPVVHSFTDREERAKWVSETPVRRMVSAKSRLVVEAKYLDNIVAH